MIPENYETSRARFRAYLPTLRDRWDGALLSSHALPYGEDLTIDWLYCAPTVQKERLFVLSTGLHGIEGYIGAALLELFMAEFLPRLDPQTTGLLLIHTINPWGMKHRNRGNPKNVDLNRNFVDAGFDSLADINPDYPDLAWFLNPQRPLGRISLERLGFQARVPATMLRYGVRRLRQAALMGQYIMPSGVYYGGQAVQPETRVMMDLYRSAFAGCRRVLHLDMHTGYGPRDQMTLVTSARETRTSQELASRYGLPRVAAPNPEEFYKVNGDMLDWEAVLVQTAFPEAQYFGAVFEFGTFGASLAAQIRSLQISVLKNQANAYGGSSAALAWVEREYGELFLPTDPAWLVKALEDGRLAFNNILAREGFFLEPI